MKCISIVTLVLVIAAARTNAEISLPGIFSDNMVLQRNNEIPVWGWADAGEKITVLLKDQKTTIKADKEGKWMVALNPEPEGGPFTMRISGKNEIILQNILIGDVWVCSGQSNMEWPLWKTVEGEPEVSKANYPQIRLLTVPHLVSSSPVNTMSGNGWITCTPEHVMDFSAIAYYFGKFLQKETGVPVGLISDNWGGTRIEPWISSETCSTETYLDEWLSKLKNIDLETLKEQEKENHVRYNELLDEALGKNGSPHPYSLETFDDAQWPVIPLPGLWEDSKIGNFDGIVWFRKKFIIPGNFDIHHASVYVGKIDDSDITWVNGHMVGQTYMQYQKLRHYTLQDSLLRVGENTIVVRVEDYIGEGGIYGDPQELIITDGNSTIALSGDWRYAKEDLVIPRNPQSEEAGILGPNDFPTLLFNGMIHPLIPYAIKGVIWYQGESNANIINDAIRYRELFPLLIRDWRMHWNQGDFPFLFVQLANYKEPLSTPRDEAWAFLRESQSITAETVPNTGMACIIDIGDTRDIHPRNKKDVGYRLALVALKKAYHKDILSSGPTYESLSIENNRAIVTFANCGKGLTAKNKYGYVNGFQISGSDGTYYFARAEIVAPDKVAVWSAEVKNPESVRYAWANNPDDVNLYNSENLPAVPFRTDDR